MTWMTKIWTQFDPPEWSRCPVPHSSSSSPAPALPHSSWAEREGHWGRGTQGHREGHREGHRDTREGHWGTGRDTERDTERGRALAGLALLLCLLQLPGPAGDRRICGPGTMTAHQWQW